MRRIIAVDPGSQKCGVALISGKQLVTRTVVGRSDLVPWVKDRFDNNTTLVVGDRTGSQEFVAQLRKEIPGVSQKIAQVDEHNSSQEARVRYWRIYPRRGWRRLIPTSFQVPPGPIDDLVAVILAERYLGCQIQETEGNPSL